MADGGHRGFMRIMKKSNLESNIGNELYPPPTKKKQKGGIIHHFMTSRSKVILPIWRLAVILDLCKLEKPNLKNNTRNELYNFKNPNKEVLHIILRRLVKKLYFQYGGWRPSWIYANYENCPKFPFGQPS